MTSTKWSESPWRVPAIFGTLKSVVTDASARGPTLHRAPTLASASGFPVETDKKKADQRLE